MKEILYWNGTILTMADPLYAKALLVRDGRICAVGDEAQLRSMVGCCEEVDLHGATLMPGFLDPHSHFSQMASACLQVSLEGVSTVEEMGRRIQQFIKESHLQPEEWVSARGYDNNIMPHLQNPTLEELDTLAPGYPLIIHHKSGHMGLMNTLALSKLGITPNTPVPDGGKIEVKNGALTGYLEENAFITYLKKLPMTEPSHMKQAFLKAQEQYASYGITTIQDGMVVKEMLPMYQMLCGEKLLRLDVVAFPSPEAYDTAVEQFGTAPSEQYLRIGGMKIFLDGSPQGRTAWMRTPYTGEQDYCGYGTMTDEAVRSAMELACERKAQLLCHCNGDGAAEQYLRCLEQVEREHPEMAQLRPVIIHGQLLGVDQLPSVKALGAMVSFFVAHVYHWGDVHIRNFGMDRAAQISPARSALEQGIPITFHQDAPVIQPDMLETIWCAVNRTTRQGVHLGEEEEISVLDALRAVTCNAAYQYFEQGDKGTLETGKRADLVVLSENPLTAPKEQLRQIQVLGTYKDGQLVYAGGERK